MNLLFWVSKYAQYPNTNTILTHNTINTLLIIIIISMFLMLMILTKKNKVVNTFTFIYNNYQLHKLLI